MIQLEQQQHGEFVVVGGVADTNYLYPARWGWINYKNYTTISTNKGSIGLRRKYEAPGFRWLHHSKAEK